METQANGSLSLTISSDEGFSLIAVIDDALPFSDHFNIQNGFTLEVSEERFYIEGSIDRIDLNELASVVPTSGDSIGFSLEKQLSGPLQITVDPARLDLNPQGIQSVVDINGGSTDTPFTFSNVGPWSASIALKTLTLDPDGDFNALKPIVEVSSSSGTGTLAQGTINGNAFALPTFTANRSGNVDFTWFPGDSTLQSQIKNVDVGDFQVSLGAQGISLNIENRAASWTLPICRKSDSLALSTSRQTASPSLSILPRPLRFQRTSLLSS